VTRSESVRHGGRDRGTRLKLLLAVTIVAVMVLSAILLVTQSPGQNSQCKGTALCYTGTVENIVDGDTLDIGGKRIRLTLVNTPEIGQAGYEEAKQFTATLCTVGSQALVDEDDGQTGGSYGRVIAVVYCGGKNLNAELLSAGHASIMTQYCSVSEFASEPWASDCR